jgi:ubiquinone/menaquinone biosynthesis C-methylase UbiE
MKFNEIAMEIFTPIYPVLAEQIIDECCITRGVCVDMGTGPALLALQVAKRTNLIIYALDLSEEMLKVARENVGEAGLNGKVVPICGDVHVMPFKNGFADLIISRGSLPFWCDKVKAFREIYRVLKVGGLTFIGGGLGRDIEVRNKIKEKMLRLQKEMPNFKKARLTAEYLQLILEKAQIPKFKILSDESGLWIKIEK